MSTRLPRRRHHDRGTSLFSAASGHGPPRVHRHIPRRSAPVRSAIGWAIPALGRSPISATSRRIVSVIAPAVIVITKTVRSDLVVMSVARYERDGARLRALKRSGGGENVTDAAIIGSPSARCAKSNSRRMSPRGMRFLSARGGGSNPDRRLHAIEAPPHGRIVTTRAHRRRQRAPHTHSAKSGADRAIRCSARAPSEFLRVDFAIVFYKLTEHGTRLRAAGGATGAVASEGPNGFRKQASRSGWRRREGRRARRRGERSSIAAILRAIRIDIARRTRRRGLARHREGGAQARATPCA